jgi:hypothetical protein
MFAFAVFATIGMLIPDCGKIRHGESAAALWHAAAAPGSLAARITL